MVLDAAVVPAIARLVERRAETSGQACSHWKAVGSTTLLSTVFLRLAVLQAIVA